MVVLVTRPGPSRWRCTRRASWPTSWALPAPSPSSWSWSACSLRRYCGASAAAGTKASWKECDVTTTINATGTPTRQTQQHERPSRAGKLLKMNWIGGTLGWIWLVIVIVPLYWIVITSFKTQANYFFTNTFEPPSHPTLDNYKTVLDNDIIRYFLNSVVVTLGATVPAVIISFMAAFAIVRGVGNRWLRWINNLFLTGLAIPLQAV